MRLEKIKSMTLVRAVDDDEDVRKAMGFLLKCNGWSCKFYSEASSFLEEDDPSVPGCLVLDVRMPKMSGLQLQDKLLGKNYPNPIIFLSAHGNIEMVVDTMHKGAWDFLEKPMCPQKLLSAVEKYCTLSLRQKFPFYFMSHQELTVLMGKLSAREAQIVNLVAEGLPSRLIAERLGLSEKTVENHRISACKKIGVHSIKDIVDLFASLKRN